MQSLFKKQFFIRLDKRWDQTRANIEINTESKIANEYRSRSKRVGRWVQHVASVRQAGVGRFRGDKRKLGYPWEPDGAWSSHPGRRACEGVAGDSVKHPHIGIGQENYLRIRPPSLRSRARAILQLIIFRATFHDIYRIFLILAVNKFRKVSFRLYYISK